MPEMDRSCCQDHVGLPTDTSSTFQISLILLQRTQQMMEGTFFLPTYSVQIRCNSLTGSIFSQEFSVIYFVKDVTSVRTFELGSIFVCRNLE